MCTTELYISRTCAHKWFEIDAPCGKDMNFSNCPKFKDGQIRYPASKGIPLRRKCPECDQGNKYYGDMVRVVGLVTMGFVGERGPEYELGGRGLGSGERVVRVECCAVM